MVESSGAGFLKKRHLWLCRPDFPHGWTGVPGHGAEVAVFQFPHLPQDLAHRLPDEKWIGVELTSAECRRIRVLTEKTSRYWRTPLPGRFLHFEHVLIELSIIVFESLRLTMGEDPLNMHQQRRVMNALKWFEEHMAECPGLEAVSRAVGVSASQLRRDFLLIIHMSPKKTFDDIRLKRALEILHMGGESVERVAERCGYLSGSSFSRAFKSKFGRSPRNILPLPKPSGAASTNL